MLNNSKSEKLVLTIPAVSSDKIGQGNPFEKSDASSAAPLSTDSDRLGQVVLLNDKGASVFTTPGVERGLSRRAAPSKTMKAPIQAMILRDEDESVFVIS